MLRKVVSIFALSLIAGLAFSCTSFGVITDNGTIISKNRDYFYGHQRIETRHWLKQFVSWYGNSYHHHYDFFALVSQSDVKFGVNQAGLAAIEEDPIYPPGSEAQRKYAQPYVGYSEGMVLSGILQNFATVEEIVPYINQIFSTAAPNFYQIADAHTILTVEVAFGNSDDDPVRPYTYAIINTPGDYFTHTNTYLYPEFLPLNALSTNHDAIQGAWHRLKEITHDVQSAHGDFSHAMDWYLDTSSTVGSSKDKNYCQNTSIFRSYLPHLTSVGPETDSTTDYGTVSSFMVANKGGVTWVYVRLLESIDVLDNGDQRITLKSFELPLDKLFDAKPINYTQHTFIRKAPLDGICH